MRPAFALLGAAAAAFGLAVTAPSHADPVDPVADAFRAGDCTRCHVVPGQVDAVRTESCHGCHVWIKAVSADPVKRAKALEVFPLWPRYEKNVASFLEVPSIEAAMARLKPQWVRAYLADPYDLRPGLPETMPRFHLSDAQLDALQGFFAAHRANVPASPAPDPGRVAAGEKVFADRGCPACHAFGARNPAAPYPLAPDLAHARERMTPDMLTAWIADPKSVSPAATMPTLGLTPDEVLAVRDYVLLAPPLWKPSPALADAIAAATPTTYADVDERVFGKICRHCHMNPATEGGRAGPGNAGGFGWPATGIELEDYDGVKAAAAKIPDALRRRRFEGPRDHVAPGESPATLARPDKPGMPLGLPPLPDEDIALVLRWIDDGCPK